MQVCYSSDEEFYVLHESAHFNNSCGLANLVLCNSLYPSHVVPCVVIWHARCVLHQPAVP